MPFHIFQKAIIEARNNDDYPVFGGGEPTVHPQFKEFLKWEMETRYPFEGSNKPFIITNGKLKRKALWLANLCEQGWYDVELSLDDYHARIDGEVIQRFRQLSASLNRRMIRSNTKIAPIGRAKNLPEAEEKYDCICPDMIVKPDGTVKQCGCPDAPTLGTIYSYQWVNAGLCHREQEFV